MTKSSLCSAVSLWGFANYTIPASDLTTWECLMFTSPNWLNDANTRSDLEYFITIIKLNFNEMQDYNHGQKITKHLKILV